MDFLLFHSQFSPSSKKLFDDFPALERKSISVDSPAMRKYLKKLGVVCVPTLIVLLNNRVIDRVIGYDSIYQWLVTSIYRINHLQPQVFEEEQQSVPTPTVKVVEKPPISEMMMTEAVASDITPLDNLILEDNGAPEQEIALDMPEIPIVQTGQSMNTMMIAEQMKKERDNNISLPGNKKMFPH